MRKVIFKKTLPVSTEGLKLKEITISIKRTVSHDYQTLSLMASETHAVEDCLVDIPKLRNQLFNKLNSEIEKIINEEMFVDIRPGE